MSSIIHGFDIFLLATTIRATLILAVTAVVAWLARCTSASVQHMVWAAGLGLSFVFPVAGSLLPSWRAEVSPAFAPAASLPSPADSYVVSSQKMSNAAAADVASTQSSDAENSTMAPQLSSHATLPDWVLFAIWSGGAIWVFARMLQGVRIVGRIARKAVPVMLGPLADLASESVVDMHASAEILTLFASPDSPVSVPLTFGLLHPTIVLPAGSETWPEERLRAAIQHEIAHIRRKDYATFLFSHLVRVIYWFHPLVWLAEKRIRETSETACDDLVLASGVTSQSYARQLLDVAIGARNGRILGSGAIAMATSPRIEQRLKSVLDPTSNRIAVRWKYALAPLVVGIVLAVPIAMVKLEAQRIGVLKPSGLSGAIQDVPGGGDVVLDYVSTRPPEAPKTWDGNGRFISHPPSWLTALRGGVCEQTVPMPKHQATMVNLHFSGIGPIYGFVFNVRGVAADRDIVLSTPDDGISAGMVADALPGEPHIKGVKTLWFTSTEPTDRPTATVRVGISDTDWNQRGTFAPIQGQVEASWDSSQISNGVAHTTNQMDISCSPASMIKGKLSYVITDDRAGYSSRLVAIDKNGHTIVADMMKNGGAASLETMTATFPNLKATDIKELDFEVRPYTWLEFKNIPLRPSVH